MGLTKNWDCSIEEMADNAAQGCPEVPTQPHLPGYGYPGFTTASKTVKASEDYTAIAEQLIKKLWKDSASKQINNIKQNDNPYFAQMALDKSSGFACTQQMCGKKYYLLCFYQRDARGWPKVYEPGNSDADICNRCRQNCTDSLCPYPLSPLADKTSSDVCKGCSKDLKDDFRLTALHIHNYYR
ncbi:hypothetical protein Y032_0133g1798 [Ancylostoma ceylanicum]|uniref:4Fe-4S ferredoxin-type domain-containing protein n=1 Tax=Ancylostoma ceylanicum TaxID=53326 RepID=A0A016T694_9BILA|nr:hypothetical protein Y032_0133g1798 [Ancylostoma ceylanicum]